ncbi:MAG: hypothetical protein EOM64_00940 [Erysipelotrichia bacterium]|nr:hypothetical protein [Erysipelotrichia bacterium]
MQVLCIRMPLIKEADKETFVELCIRWNQENAWQRIEGIAREKGQYSLAFHEGPRSLMFAEFAKYDLLSMKYEIADSRRIEAVMNRERQFITISASVSESAPESDAISAVNTVMALAKLFIRSGITDSESGIASPGEAVSVNASDYTKAVNVILNRQPFLMPAVIVSRTSFGRPAVPPKKIAARLIGLAHLLVLEEDRASTLLVSDCGTLAPYGGRVGIYYPDGKNSILHSENFESEKNVIQEVLSQLQTWLKNQKPGMLEQYDSISNHSDKGARQIVTVSSSRAGYEQKPLQPKAVHKDALAELQKQMEEMQKKLAQAQKKQTELEEDSSRLKQQNHDLKQQLLHMNMPGVLIQGDESDYYPGEIRSLAIEALAGACVNAAEGSRRRDVYQDLIKANGSDTACAQHAARIKNLMKGYSVMTSPIKSVLEAEGYSIREEGKHCKLLWHNDPRYYAIVPKSGSDVRGGDNIAREMIRKFY